MTGRPLGVVPGALSGGGAVGGLRQPGLVPRGGALVEDALGRGLVVARAMPPARAWSRASASPSAIAASTFFVAVFSEERTALFRALRFSF